MSRIILGVSGFLVAWTAHADTVAFNSFGPGNTYDGGSVYYVGKAGSFPTEQAAQFISQASGFPIHGRIGPDLSKRPSAKTGERIFVERPQRFAR